MAKQKKGRDISGILLFDKPLGLSSNKALQSVKTLFQAQKAGHTGSLDPLATGLLPICFGEATKFSQYLLNADKVYITRIKLGEKSATGDSEGEIIQTRAVDFAFEVLVEILSKFVGAQSQIPSMYSAIKQQGQPLYKLARKGIEVEREARSIFIYELRLTSDRRLFEEKQEIELYVHCSKGTYIRNLAEDIGEAAGCGAHLLALRRLKTGQFEHMNTLEQLQQHSQSSEQLDAFLLPLDAALQDFPFIEVDASQADAIRFGKTVQISQTDVLAGVLRLYVNSNTKREFLGLADLSEDKMLRAKRLLRTN